MAVTFVDRQNPKLDVVNALREEFWAQVEARHGKDFSEIAHHLIEGSLYYRALEENHVQIVTALKGPKSSAEDVERELEALFTGIKARNKKVDGDVAQFAENFNAKLDRMLAQRSMLSTTITSAQREQLFEQFQFHDVVHMCRSMQNAHHVRMGEEPKTLKELEAQILDHLHTMWPGNLAVEARMRDFRDELEALNISAEKDAFYTAKAQEWIVQNHATITVVLQRAFSTRDPVGALPTLQQFVLEVVKEALAGQPQKEKGFLSRILAPLEATPLARTYLEIDNIMGGGKRAALETQLRELAVPRIGRIGGPG